MPTSPHAGQFTATGKPAMPAPKPTIASAPPSETLRSADELARAGLIEPADIPAVRAVTRRYAVAVTPAVRDAIAAAPGDALARQYVPSADELVIAGEELLDPIGDAAHAPVKGIVHRYPDRVLLKPMHACAVYCRFCFRREDVGPSGDALDGDELAAALAYIRNDKNIWEVILSGGDPLLLSPRRLKAIIGELARMDHVGVIRIHTRLPVADPDRVTAERVAALKCAKAVYVVVHCNHADELTAPARAACARLVDAGLPMLAQTVLLKGVNDDALQMERLLRELTAARIKPYYLHHPDLARGTGHFRTTLARGRALLRRLRGRLSGLAQPTYVLDIPGGHGKVPIGPDYLSRGPDGRWRVRDPAGRSHPYPPRRQGPPAPCGGDA
jgi:lysine 2,3-aminomutase